MCDVIKLMNPLTTGLSGKPSLKQNFQLSSRLTPLLEFRQWITMTVTLTGFIKDLGKFETP